MPESMPRTRDSAKRTTEPAPAPCGPPGPPESPGLGGAQAALVSHLPAVRRWCMRRAGDAHLADDVVQETALAALTRLGQLRRPECLRNWLFRIAKCRLADLARRASPSWLPITVEPPAPAPEDSPGEWIAGEDVRRRLRRCIRTLPRSLRLPLRMHYLQGHSVREVARRLELTRAGVKARLYRARKLLKAKVAR